MCDSPRGTHRSHEAPMHSKAAQTVVPAGRRDSIRQREPGLPLAPWALLRCWWSPELETHSKHVVLHGEARVCRKMPSGRRPQQPSRNQLGSSAPRPHLKLCSKLHSRSCILERETLLREQTTAPMRLCSAKQRLPFSPPGLWSP